MIGDFAYHRATTVEDAVVLLADLGGGGEDGAAVLAGGQSLLPAMKAGTRRPRAILDIGRVTGLGAVREEDGHLVLGALVRHHDLHTSPVVRRLAPLLAHVAGGIADPQVRHRGTLGGSLAFADPAADLPVALLALDATVVLHGPAGRREVPVAEFPRGAHRTACGPDELLTEVRVPARPDAAWSYRRFSRDALEWAVVAVAAVRPDGDPRRVTVALGNVADRPLPATAVMAAVAEGLPVEAAAARAADHLDPPSDTRASPEYRRHLARVLTARALHELRL